MKAPRRQVAEEFFRRPFGRHSAELHDVLVQMRSLPIPGKHFLFMTEPHEQWTLARMSTVRPLRLELQEDVVFTDLADAERHVFRLRWRQLYGSDLDLA